MSEPLACLLTWTTYGSWLHGDDRGSVDRDHRTSRMPFLPGDTARLTQARRRARHASVTLHGRARHMVMETVIAHCNWREWEVLALNVRSNHVHVVIGYAGLPPETMLAQLKAWCTRHLRELGTYARDAPLWTHHGSTRYLWTRDSLRQACDYVTEGQGPDITPVSPR